MDYKTLDELEAEYERNEGYLYFYQTEFSSGRDHWFVDTQSEYEGIDFDW